MAIARYKVYLLHSRRHMTDMLLMPSWTDTGWCGKVEGVRSDSRCGSGSQCRCEMHEVCGLLRKCG